MNKSKIVFIALILSIIIAISGCVGGNGQEEVPNEGRWGIYSLDLYTQETSLIFSLEGDVPNISLNPSGDTFVFSMPISGHGDEDKEICSVSTSGSDFNIITNNGYWDLYPVWSHDGQKIAFLTWRDDDLDIYLMDHDGGNEMLLHDSGHHDADLNWSSGRIVFTAFSCIYIMDEDGTNVRQVSSPENAGIWGEANLPFGDYDPRLDPSGTKIVFERLESDDSPHGNYNMYLIDPDGSNEVRITETSYSQGLASWSHSGEDIAFIVAAIGEKGKYDIYMMEKDGNNMRNITPDYYPEGFICRSPIFSYNDEKIYFIGEWWE